MGDGDADARPAIQVRLLDGFAVVVDGARVDLSACESRLVAFLALHDGIRSRVFVAGTLWPDVAEERARGNLRSALWRLRGTVPGLVEGGSRHVALASTALSDTQSLARVAASLRDAHTADALPETADFNVDLLPGWYEDWVLYERERLRQLCLHALERLAERLLERRDFGTALDAALTSVRAEPLRESAHRLAVRIHLAEGNVVEALRQYGCYVDLARDELGVAPSASFSRMLADVGRMPVTAVAAQRPRSAATV